MKNKDEKLSFRLGADLKKKILEQAKVNEISASKFIEQLVQGYFAASVTGFEKGIILSEEEAITSDEQFSKSKLWTWLLSLGIFSFFTIILLRLSRRKGF